MSGKQLNHDEFYAEAQQHLGALVTYVKDGGRNGWKGRITSVTRDNFTVFYPETNVEQPYSLSALGLPSGNRHPLDYSGDRNSHGYILVTEGAGPIDADLYIVAGADGGSPARVFGLSRATEVAKQEAAKSKSGQAYCVFKAVLKAQRETPPIKVTEL